jgi:SH3-like domain-containing protein
VASNRHTKKARRRSGGNRFHLRALGRAARLATLAATLVAPLVAGPPGPAQAQAQPETAALPRFASMAAERINVRAGPGKQYPIRWVYARAGLPVKIVEAFDTWRRIEDHDGDTGWIHVSLLSGRRTVMLTGDIQPLLRAPDRGARIVLRAEPGVIGRLLACREAWCEVEIARQRGWLERRGLWGLLPGESPGGAG